MVNLTAVFVIASISATIFGIVYLFYTTRHRERMALIEKEQDASLFYPDAGSLQAMRRAVVLNIALTLIGIGLGIIFGILLQNATSEEGMVPAAIFVMAGVGLTASFLINRNLKDE